MNAISSHTGTAMSHVPALLPLHGRSGTTPIALKGREDAGASAAIPLTGGNHGAEELRETFAQFVGEMFYGQMFKAMRQTVSKPAYFHGGRAEEAFQGQLDQTMTEQLTKATASKFAEPMFERQFPHLVATERAANDLGQLAALSRR